MSDSEGDASLDYQRDASLDYQRDVIWDTFVVNKLTIDAPNHIELVDGEEVTFFGIFLRESANGKRCIQLTETGHCDKSLYGDDFVHKILSRETLEKETIYGEINKLSLVAMIVSDVGMGLKSLRRKIMNEFNMKNKNYRISRIRSNFDYNDLTLSSKSKLVELCATAPCKVYAHLKKEDIDVYDVMGDTVDPKLDDKNDDRIDPVESDGDEDYLPSDDEDDEDDIDSDRDSDRDCDDSEKDEIILVRGSSSESEDDEDEPIRYKKRPKKYVFDPDDDSDYNGSESSEADDELVHKRKRKNVERGEDSSIASSRAKRKCARAKNYSESGVDDFDDLE